MGGGFPPYQNANTPLLNMNADSASSDWRHADENVWGLTAGRVLVRNDQLDITPHQVEALVHYCRYEILLAAEKKRQELRGKAAGGVGAEKAKLVKGWMFRDWFEEFF
jgi:hypothetical protein